MRRASPPKGPTRLGELLRGDGVRDGIRTRNLLDHNQALNQPSSTHHRMVVWGLVGVDMSSSDHGFGS